MYNLITFPAWNCFRNTTTHIYLPFQRTKQEASGVPLNRSSCPSPNNEYNDECQNHACIFYPIINTVPPLNQPQYRIRKLHCVKDIQCFSLCFLKNLMKKRRGKKKSVYQKASFMSMHKQFSPCFTSTYFNSIHLTEEYTTTEKWIQRIIKNINSHEMYPGMPN